MCYVIRKAAASFGLCSSARGGNGNTSYTQQTQDNRPAGNKKHRMPPQTTPTGFRQQRVEMMDHPDEEEALPKSAKLGRGKRAVSSRCGVVARSGAKTGPSFHAHKRQPRHESLLFESLSTGRAANGVPTGVLTGPGLGCVAAMDTESPLLDPTSAAWLLELRHMKAFRKTDVISLEGAGGEKMHPSGTRQT